MHDDKIVVEYSYYVKYMMSGLWDIGNGCTILQHGALATRKKIMVQKDAKAR